MAHAQTVLYSQTFEDTLKSVNVCVLLNLDKAKTADTAWKALNDSAWVVRRVGTTGNHAVIATSNYAPVHAADDWIILPAIRLGNASKLSWKNISLTPGKTDTYQVYISTTEQSLAGCLFNGIVGDFTSSNTNVFETNTLDLALKGFKNQYAYIGFRLNTVSGGDKIALDDITVTDDQTKFVSLTFIVNMKNYISAGKFVPKNDTVDVAGNFNNWNGTNNILSIVPGSDSSIYSTVIPGFLDGDNLEFKFRINSTWSDSIVEFPYGQPNRMWTVEHDKYTYTCFYNDQGIAFGIEENPFMKSVNVYPNPASDFVAVQVPDEIERIVLLDLTGKKIGEKLNLKESTLIIDIGHLPANTYILVFYTHNGFAGIRKLVKNGNFTH